MMHRFHLLAGFSLIALVLAALTGCSDGSTEPETGPTARTWHVPGDWPTITAAADTAKAGDTIMVAAGTYYESGIVLEPGVDLRGATSRSIDVVIDGLGLGRVLEVYPDTLTGARTDTTSVITDLEIRGGSGDTDGGGGLLATSGIEVRNCRFVDNGADGPGGGLRTRAADVLLSHCTFDSNHTDLAGSNGGGMSLGMYTYQLAVIDTCLFTANRAADTGGAVNILGPGQMTGCGFLDNTARNGGAILGGDLTLTHCDFQGNSATLDGGSGIGGALYLAGGSQQLRHCDFQENTATTGSAISASGADLDVMDCDFWDNQSSGSGTLNLVGGSSPVFQHCEFLNNTAYSGGAFKSWGGANPTFTDCLFDGNSATEAGVGEFNDDGTVTLNACQLTDNTSTSLGGALANLSMQNGSPAIMILNECTVSENEATVSGGAFFLGQAAQLTANYTTFSANTAGEFSGGFVGMGCTATLTCCTATEQVFGGPGTVTIDDEGCEGVPSP